MKFEHKQLSDTVYEVFDAADEKKRSYANFRLMDAPPQVKTPIYCKHTQVNIFQEVVDEIFQQRNFALLLRIYRFIFNSVLEITYEKKRAKMCKLYSDEISLAAIYRDFARELERQGYKVKMYRNWVEIEKPS
jgi:hypothetical protein